MHDELRLSKRHGSARGEFVDREAIAGAGPGAAGDGSDLQKRCTANTVAAHDCQKAAIGGARVAPPRRQPSLRRQTVPGSVRPIAANAVSRRKATVAQRRPIPTRRERRRKDEDRAGVDLRHGIAWRDDRDTAPRGMQEHDEQPDHECFASAHQRDAHPAQRRQARRRDQPRPATVGRSAGSNRSPPTSRSQKRKTWKMTSARAADSADQRAMARALRATRLRDRSAARRPVPTRTAVRRPEIASAHISGRRDAFASGRLRSRPRNGHRVGNNVGRGARTCDGHRAGRAPTSRIVAGSRMAADFAADRPVSASSWCCWS